MPTLHCNYKIKTGLFTSNKVSYQKYHKTEQEATEEFDRIVKDLNAMKNIKGHIAVIDSCYNIVHQYNIKKGEEKECLKDTKKLKD